MIQIHPVPTTTQLHAYYARVYRREDFNARANLDSFPLDNLWYLSRGRALFQLARRHLPPFTQQQPRILEIGSGFGHVLWAFRETTPEWQRFACEPDVSCGPFLHRCGAHVFQTFIDEADSICEPAAAGPFDVIILSHVLEHPGDPVAFLKLAAKMLTRTGYMIVEVPHSPLREVRWAEDHTPHVAFFTKKTLRDCMRLSGGEVLFLDTCGPPLPSYGPWPQRHLRRFARRVIPRSLRSALGSRVDSFNVATDVLPRPDELPLPQFGVYGNEEGAFLRTVVRFETRE